MKISIVRRGVTAIFALVLSVSPLCRAENAVGAEGDSSRAVASGDSSAVGNLRGAVGAKIDPFELEDYAGGPHRSGDWKDKTAVVVVFLGVECPLAKLYGQRLAELDEQYRDKNVQFVGINSNQQDSLSEIAGYAKTHEIRFPLLKDVGNRVADLFGAQRTPEAYVLDSTGAVRYTGAIDDQYGVGFSRPKVSKQYLVNAIEHVLAGEAVAKPSTPAVGCHIGRIKTESRGDITFTKHIAPILNRHCVSCHREGEIGPFALTSYDEAIGWGETICEVVEDRRMPPWHADPKHGEFSNDIRMPKKDIETLRQWVNNGMPQGDPNNLPPLPEFPEGWQIPKPDLIVKMPEEFKVPAKGVVPYKYYIVDPGFTEDKWVKCAEARAGNPSVVHHIILFYIPPGQTKPSGENALSRAIATFAPGMPPTMGPDAYCRRIPAGSKLVFQLHYTPNGSEQVDRSEAGIVFADPTKVRKEIRLDAAFNFRFAIPPGEGNYPVNAKHLVRQDSVLYSMTPHMHVRGKSFRVLARYPDEREEVLLDVPRYDFNWQNIYLLKQPKVMPRGTELVCEARFDNSTENKANPDPTQTVRWGDQTWEEMMIGSFGMSMVDQDLTLGAPRQKKLENGKYEVTFRYRPEQPVGGVHLTGEFAKWVQDALPMEGPDADGFFTLTHELAPGRYEYKFVVDGNDWKADPGMRERTLEFDNSVLHVGKP